MILAVDIGTTSLKGGVFADDGTLLYLDRLILPKPDHRGFDPDWWLEGFVSYLEKYKETGGVPSALEGVVISGHGPTLTALGDSGEPLCSALMWYEGKTGSVEGESLYLPLVSWFREKHGELYEKTRAFLGCSEYLLYRLTGLRLTVTSGPSFSSYIWTDDSLNRNRFDKRKFCEYVNLGEKSRARLTAGAARLTGLKEGIPVYSGGSDFYTSLLGAGSVEPGIVCDRAGTSEGLNMIIPRALNHNHIRVLPHPSVREGVYNGSIILSSTGSLFEWYRRLTGQESWPYERTMEGITSSRRDRLSGFFPSLNDGGLWEFSGGMLLGLEPDMDRFELGRAVLEAIGYALKRGLSILEKEGGRAERIVTVGGQSKSPLWNRMKADMLGRKIEVPLVQDAELLGGLVVFLKGEGSFASLKEGSRRLYRVGSVIEPAEADWYREKFSRYKELSGGVRDFYGSYGVLISGS
ncbi:MAG: FGGY-family carbohydrate kinase [Spirochaetales bacterium]|nr:FGGY-family carbohydrate kinase [Spirochaetales bacterium]